MAKDAAPADADADGRDETYEMTEDQMALRAALVPAVDMTVAALAVQFEATGAPPMTAASIAASLMVDSAWKFAATVRIATTGTDPNPENFIGLAQDATQRFHFDRANILSRFAAEDAIPTPEGAPE